MLIIKIATISLKQDYLKTIFTLVYKLYILHVRHRHEDF